jgi:adenosylcobinamide kinase/adenosylcobinamide-phosphate guanylyltransferase
MLILVLGPVRSGKSARAAALADATRKRVIVAATAAADPSDPEWCERIERHRRDRPAAWDVVETADPQGPELATLLRETPSDACVLVDALGTWLAQELLAWDEAAADASAAALEARCAELVAALRDAAATTIVVAEETGWGVVPVSPLGRLFRDTLGRLVQRMAANADRVELVVAGFAIDLRAVGTPIEDVSDASAAYASKRVADIAPSCEVAKVSSASPGRRVLRVRRRLL